MTAVLRLGTRPSALAVAQSELVAQRLPHSNLADDLDAADAAVMRLRDLYPLLAEPAAAAMTSSSSSSSAESGPTAEPNLRARAIIRAVLAALCGVAVVVGILWYLDGRLTP